MTWNRWWLGTLGLALALGGAMVWAGEKLQGGVPPQSISRCCCEANKPGTHEATTKRPAEPLTRESATGVAASSSYGPGPRTLTKLDPAISPAEPMPMDPPPVPALSDPPMAKPTPAPASPTLPEAPRPPSLPAPPPTAPPVEEATPPAPPIPTEPLPTTAPSVPETAPVTPPMPGPGSKLPAVETPPPPPPPTGYPRVPVPAPLDSKKPAPPVPYMPESPPPVAHPHVPPTTSTVPENPVPTPIPPCPWTLRVEIVEGRTHLEAKNGDEVCFRVNCQHLDLQAPKGAIKAEGTVKVSGNGFEGSCERLTISWHDDGVAMDGAVLVKCHKEGRDLQVTGERVMLKLREPAKGKGARRDGGSKETPLLD